jgi:hypothetical protein
MLETDDILFDTPNLSPEVRLWLACLRDAVASLKERRFGDNTPAKRLAREFVFDGHPGFAWLCDALGYEPEALRRRVRKATIERKNHD